MIQEIIIRNSKWYYGLYLMLYGGLGLFTLYELFAEPHTGYWFRAYCLLLCIMLTVRSDKRIDDPSPKLIVSEQGIRIHPTVLWREAWSAEVFLPWDDIRQTELPKLALNSIKLHTHSGECLQLNLDGLAVGRLRTFHRKLEALRQAAPEQRVKLIARFQAA